MKNESVSEFFKLDPVDKKTLFWLMDNKPEKIKSWINFLSRQYRKGGGETLDPEKLYEEVKVELT